MNAAAGYRAVNRRDMEHVQCTRTVYEIGQLPNEFGGGQPDWRMSCVAFSSSGPRQPRKSRMRSIAMMEPGETAGAERTPWPRACPRPGRRCCAYGFRYRAIRNRRLVR